jgi:hypothetical protein
MNGMINMNSFRVLLLTLASAAALSTAACGGNPLDQGGSGNKAQATPTGTPFDIGGRACPPNSVLTYENFGEGFMRGQCTGCHSSALPEGARQNAPITVNLDTYADVRSFGARIYYRSGDQNATMPPAGGPVASERVNLGDWIACNAPREPGATGP